MSGVDRLCFGTSTFVAGRLRPDKDSAPGIAALQTALRTGVRLIHSNPKLDTQWAIRRALAETDEADHVRHLVKAEAPLDAPPGELVACVDRAIDQTCDTLGVQLVAAVVVEIDLKRTRQMRLLADATAVQDWYAQLVDSVRKAGRADCTIAYCHSPAHLATLASVSGIGGISAQFNLAEPWPALYFEGMSAMNHNFVGMAPLRRGRLVDAIVPGADPSRPFDAVRWAVADPRVSTVVVTMSTVTHVHQIIQAVSEPLPAASVREVARTWFDAGYGDGNWQSPKRIDDAPADRLGSLPSQAHCGGFS